MSNATNPHAGSTQFHGVFADGVRVLCSAIDANHASEMLRKLFGETPVAIEDVRGNIANDDRVGVVVAL